MALKDQWQALRRQRQQELVERQQQVQDVLASFQQDRQATAAQLRDDLSLFKLELQHETQVRLATLNKERQQQAEALNRFLQLFTQDLQAETADFLKLTAIERSLMAQQLAYDLSTFRAQLNQTMAALRQSLQSRIQTLQAETQALLQANQEARSRTRMQLVEDLGNFIDTLRASVHTYLSELELLRQERAQELQSMLASDRQQRHAEMTAMFQDLAEFRADLRQFHSNLTAMVWGGAEATPVQEAPQQQAAPTAKPVVRSTPQTVAKAVERPSTRVVVQPQRPVTEQSPVAITPAPIQSPQPAPAPLAVAPTPVVVTEPTPVERALSAEETLIMESSHLAPKVAQADPAKLEEDIYNYVHSANGARLTEIETNLEINRFQAVDALRSLIKKGLITQRDRIYLIQEEISL